MSDQNLHRVTLGVLIAATLCFGLLIVPAGLAIMMSPMAFDSGISTAAVLFVANLLAYPLMVLLSIPVSWIAYRRGAFRTAILASLLPAINLLVLAVMFLVD